MGRRGLEHIRQIRGTSSKRGIHQVDAVSKMAARSSQIPNTKLCHFTCVKTQNTMECRGLEHVRDVVISLLAFAIAKNAYPILDLHRMSADSEHILDALPPKYHTVCYVRCSPCWSKYLHCKIQRICSDTDAGTLARGDADISSSSCVHCKSGSCGIGGQEGVIGPFARTTRPRLARTLARGQMTAAALAPHIHDHSRGQTQEHDYVILHRAPTTFDLHDEHDWRTSTGKAEIRVSVCGICAVQRGAPKPTALPHITGEELAMVASTASYATCQTGGQCRRPRCTMCRAQGRPC